MDSVLGAETVSGLRAWAEALDPNVVLFSAGLVVVVTLLRAPIAQLITAALAWGLNAAGVQVSEAVREESDATLRSIIVLLALVILLDALNPPQLAGGILRNILVSMIVVVVFAAIARRTDLIVEALVIHGNKRSLDTRWIARIIRFVVTIVGFAALLDVWGITISGALTGVGILGAGLAIAAQDFVRNLVAGITNMSEERFGPGDWIQTDRGLEGTVVSMDLRSTTVMGFDRVPRYVPNGDLSNATLMNHTRMDMRRLDWKIGLLREATDAQVQQICEEIEAFGRSSGHFVVANGVSPFAIPVALTDQAVEIRVCMFAKATSLEEYSRACGALAFKARRAVEKAGTALAYPTWRVVQDEQHFGPLV